MIFRTLIAALAVGSVAIASIRPSSAVEGRWKRTISYQAQGDQFYNFYEGPEPSSATASMYVSPRPIPHHVGHTYTTYQPFMPHEYLYRHTRSHYTYNACGGWTRAHVRYRTHGLWLDALANELSCPSGFPFNH